MDRLARQSGLSLVELLVALFIIGVVFSAAAGALISFTQVSFTNERRVQATALMNRLHEELQALPWEAVVVYEDELDQLAPLGVDSTATDPVFEGEDLVRVGAPADPIDRVSTIPRPRQTMTVDGRDYEVFTVITWAADVGDGREAKRFTTIVEWDVFGRTIEQRFESFRAPTAPEIASSPIPQIVLFEVSPTLAGLTGIDADGIGTLDTVITVRAEFSRGVDDVTLTYGDLVQQSEVVDIGGGATETVITYDQQQVVLFMPTPPEATDLETSLGTAFEWTIDAGFFDVDEPTTLTLEAILGFDTVSSSRDVSFADSVILGLAPVVRSNPTASPLTIQVAGTGTVLMCEDLAVTAFVDDLLDGGTVRAAYGAGAGEGRNMSGPLLLTGNNDRFEVVFAATTPSPWEPSVSTSKVKGKTVTTYGSVDVTFTITATNPSGVGSNQETTGTVTIQRAATCS